MTIKVIHRNGSFLKFEAPVNSYIKASRHFFDEAGDIEHEKSSISTVVLGDSHGEVNNVIHPLVLEGVIHFEQKDLDVFAQLAQSTAIDQLRAVKLDLVRLPMMIAFFDSQITEQTKQYEKMKVEREEVIEEYKNSLSDEEIANLRQKTLEDYQKILALKQELFFHQQLQVQKEALRQTLREKVREEIQRYRLTLKSMKITDLKAMITLLGDELGDRGNCDLKMLLLFNELKSRGIPINTILSNHALEFLYVALMKRWTRQDPTVLLNPEREEQARSLMNLRALCEEYLIPEDISVEILAESWMDTLHLLTSSYSIEDNAISIYSHAPIGLETIQALAKKYKIAYNDTSARSLHATIEAINAKFQASLKNDPLPLLKKLADKCCVTYADHSIEALAETFQDVENNLPDLISMDYSEDYQNIMEEMKSSFLYQLCQEWRINATHRYQYINVTQRPEMSPLLAILWNRQRAPLHRPEVYNGFHCSFINGHDTPHSKHVPGTHELEMDNFRGKSNPPTIASYVCLPHTIRYELCENSDDNDSNRYYRYDCSQDNGQILIPATETEPERWSSYRALPTQHFRGIVAIPKSELEGVSEEEVVELQIRNEISETEVPIILYSSGSQDIRYLEVKHETFSPALMKVIAQQHTDLRESPKSIIHTQDEDWTKLEAQFTGTLDYHRSGSSMNVE